MNYAISDHEQAMRQAQARAMIKVPRYAGQTYTQLKAERHRRMKVYKTYALAIAVLLLVAVAVGIWVL